MQTTSYIEDYKINLSLSPSGRLRTYMLPFVNQASQDNSLEENYYSEEERDFFLLQIFGILDGVFYSVPYDVPTLG